MARKLLAMLVARLAYARQVFTHEWTCVTCEESPSHIIEFLKLITFYSETLLLIQLHVARSVIDEKIRS